MCRKPQKSRESWKVGILVGKAYFFLDVILGKPWDLGYFVFHKMSSQINEFGWGILNDIPSIGDMCARPSDRASACGGLAATWLKSLKVQEKSWNFVSSSSFSSPKKSKNIQHQVSCLDESLVNWTRISIHQLHPTRRSETFLLEFLVLAATRNIAKSSTVAAVLKVPQGSRRSKSNFYGN